MIELYDLEAERQLLGALISRYEEVDILDTDFYFNKHRLIFKCLGGQLMEVRAELKTKGWLDEIGGDVYLSELIIEGTYNPKYYINLISELSIRRNEIIKRQQDIAVLQDRTKDITAVKHIDCNRITDETGINNFSDNADEIIDLYENGYGDIEDFGYPSLRTNLKARRGDMYVFNASPKSGKTELLASFMLNLKCKFAIFSPENAPIKRYASILFRKITGKPFNDGMHQRMSVTEISECISKCSESYRFVDIDPSERTIDNVLNKFRLCVEKYGSEGIIIDPFNKIIQDDHRINEHHWIGRTLDKIEHFVKQHNIHCWIAVHPTKLKKGDDGSYPVPTPYDISGSSYWYSKPDVLLALKRQENNEVDIHIQDLRWTELGEPGMVTLVFNRVTGQYEEKEIF